MNSKFLAIKHELWLLKQHWIAKKRYSDQVKLYDSMYKNNRLHDGFSLNENYMRPMLRDAYEEAGELDAHYFLQDIEMARAVVDSAPVVHYDIGSRIDGFIAHILSSGRIGKVVLMDVRPLSVHVEGLDFIQTDATTLNNIEDVSLESLSALHAIEHFGLGRYGDSINPESWKYALESIQKKMKVGGVFYFSVPVGPVNKLVFNAHRIFAPSTVISTLDQMNLISFKYIHEMKVIDVDINCIQNIDDLVSEYDCGLFIFVKR